jgi:hypothetical protein
VACGCGTTRRRIPASTADDGWPFAVNVATHDAAGYTATATRTLTLDRGTAVAIHGVEAATTLITRLRRAMAS